MATQTIYTNKDAFGSKINPDTNYGTINYIHIAKESQYSAGWGYIGFDITSAPLANQVTNVVYHYYRNMYSGTPTGYFRRVTSSWTETGLTWNNKANSTDTNMATATIANVETWGSVNITDIYKDAKNAGNELGIQIKQSSEDTIMIAARETAYDSYIVITHGVISDYYVKIGGNDSLSGNSWANAWATVNKAAITVPDGKTVHIGFGTYNAEPAGNKIAPQNIGVLGIYYAPEQAPGGSATPIVSIEQKV